MAQQQEVPAVDLLKPFTSYRGFKESLRQLLFPNDGVPVDPAVAILILEGLYSIEEKVQRDQFQFDDLYRGVREILRQWRCNSLIGIAYKFQMESKFLKALICFKKLEVPLFVDVYGHKRRLSDYDALENCNIDLTETSIYHVTHKEESDQIIKDNKFKPSDNKNIIAGTWFGTEETQADSFYGTWAFQTTLENLGVARLRQGEIVSYKNEVNVILYAGDNDVDDEQPPPLQKPTLNAVQLKHGNVAYVHVSIFVPSKFLPEDGEFQDKVTGVHRVPLHSMCVRKKRTGYDCQEL